MAVIEREVTGNRSTRVTSATRRTNRDTQSETHERREGRRSEDEFGDG